MVSRESLLAGLKSRLERQERPRLQTAVILLATGCSGFVASVGLHRLGVPSMALRYAMAVTAAYLVFLLGLGVWVWLRRGTMLADEPASADPEQQC